MFRPLIVSSSGFAEGKVSMAQGTLARTSVALIPKPTRRDMRRYRWLPLGLLLPTLIILVAFQVIPTLYSLYLSVTDVKDGVFQGVWLENFERLFASRRFVESLRLTATYSVFYVTLTVVLGLFIALLLNRKVKFTGWYLVIIFIPWVISDVVAGTMWRWLFQPSYGLIQYWIDQYVPFIGSSLYTSGSGAMAIIVAAGVWRGLAFATILALGALQTVPQEIIESAALDGANRFQRFFRVILPTIRSVILVMVLLTSIQAVNSLGLIFSITKGGPGGATTTASYFLYQLGWEQGRFGRGAAVSVIMFAINAILTIIYLNAIGQRREK